MAELTDAGTVIVNCSSPNCQGTRTTYEYRSETDEFGVIGYFEPSERAHNPDQGWSTQYRLFKCASCGRGAIGAVRFYGRKYPGRNVKLLWFYPRSLERLPLPPSTPEGIRHEFREAEDCMSNGSFRAAAGLFRSVLDKTMRDNGYHGVGNLAAQIDVASQDGVITQARQRRAHEDVRVLGNDILHEEWHEITRADVLPAHQYMQRILEDFYDDRESVLGLLRQAGRIEGETAETGNSKSAGQVP